MRRKGVDYEVEVQGRIFKVRARLPRQDKRPVASKRSQVTVFSRKSRKRLLELANRLDTSNTFTVFITLTYPQEYPDTATAKRHLRALLERIRRYSPEASGIWRVEYQQRGAPHFHLIIFNMRFLDKAELQRWWGEIIGYERPFTRIEGVSSHRKLVSYVAKYVAKMPEGDEGDEGDEGGGSGFNSVPYRHAGRWWGVFNRAFLPYAPLITMGFMDYLQVLYDLRRAAVHKFRFICRRNRFTGFMLFTDNPLQWLRYHDFLLQQAIQAV